MRARILGLAAWIATLMLAFSAAEASDDAVRLNWHNNYAAGYAVAQQQGKMLVVYFSNDSNACGEFEKEVLSAPAISGKLSQMVCVKLPLDAKVTVENGEIELLAQPAFRPLGNKAGVALIDLEHRTAPYYGGVVSALPFFSSQCPAQATIQALLDLPPGSPAERHVAFQAALGVIQASYVPADNLEWYSNYARAVAAAQREGKMLLIHFNDESDTLCRQFNEKSWCDPNVQGKLADYVCLRLSVAAEIEVDGQSEKMLKLAAFREMLGRPGLAIVDYTDEHSKHYGTVVSEFPLTEKYRYTPQQVAAMLDLPAGTLTQRTLIYAVRIHPERPASTEGNALPALGAEAESHSQYQADIRLQGHHRWETRFHRVNAQLPGGGASREVCAESWAGQGLLDAAIECVRCWRTSSGHWSAVRARHAYFGYDMKLGRNGVWYATGIFGGR